MLLRNRRDRHAVDSKRRRKFAEQRWDVGDAIESARDASPLENADDDRPPNASVRLRLVDLRDAHSLRLPLAESVVALRYVLRAQVIDY